MTEIVTVQAAIKCAFTVVTVFLHVFESGVTKHLRSDWTVPQAAHVYHSGQMLRHRVYSVQILKQYMIERGGEREGGEREGGREGKGGAILSYQVN